MQFVLLFIIFLLVVFEKNYVLLMYPLYLLVKRYSHPVQSFTKTVFPPQSLRFYITFVVFSLCTFELFSWLSNYATCDPESFATLLHPQLFWDMVYGFGFYSGLAVGWMVMLRYFRFSLREVFLLQGFYGVFIEQLGAAFFAGLNAFPVGVLVWLFLFVVYGCLSASVFAITGVDTKASFSVKKYLFTLAALFVSTLSISFLYGIPFLLLEINPTKFPICQRPFF